MTVPTRPAGPPAPLPFTKRPWESELDEQRVAISVRMPRSLKARLDGLSDHLALTEPGELPDSLGSVGNQTEVFNMSLHLFLAAAEAELNGGQPFPVRIRRR